MLQEIAGDGANGRPIKGNNNALDSKMTPLTSSEMDPEKALGTLSEDESRDVSGNAMAVPKSSLGEQQINQTHNENVADEKNINSASSALGESSSSVLQAQQEKPEPVKRVATTTTNFDIGTEEGKSTVAKVEKSFGRKSQTTSSAPQHTVDAAPNSPESAREAKREATTGNDKTSARGKAPAALASVSVELSKRSVGGKSGSHSDGDELTTVVDSANISVDSIAVNTGDKVVITTTTTGDKCRYASVFLELVFPVCCCSPELVDGRSLVGERWMVFGLAN